MFEPSSRGGDSTTWNGPSTVDSVDRPPVRWFIVSTSIETPRTSDSRMNSCRTSSLMCPVRVRKSTAKPPLLLGQFHVLDEVVQVPHQRREHLLQPWVRR